METPNEVSSGLAYEPSNGTASLLKPGEHLGGVEDAGNHADLTHPSSQASLDDIVADLASLSTQQLQELGSIVVAKVCLEKQQQNLREFSAGFADLADPDFRATQPTLMQSFVDMVSGMTVKISEQALDSTSSQTGTITIALPGLPDGVNVTRSHDNFYVNDGNTLLERNEVRLKMGGLDVYSGYWLSADQPGSSIEDPLQEEGIDTLRRVMEAAGITFAEGVYEDALEYPFLSAMLAPFGPDAVQPFEAHLRGLHRDYNHSHGGCWFRMTSPGKSRSKLAQVLETEDGSFDPEATTEDDQSVSAMPRSQLTAAEEADLELSKLDL